MYQYQVINEYKQLEYRRLPISDNRWKKNYQSHTEYPVDVVVKDLEYLLCLRVQSGVN